MSLNRDDDPERDRRAAISLEWLVRLRWWTAFGQTATVGFARAALGPEIHLHPLLAYIAILGASNLALATPGLRRFSPSRLCASALALDTLLLTGLLQAAGGPYNPFSVLYLVYVALAAVVLRVHWTWSLAGLASFSYGLLFVHYVPLEHLDHSGPGMWLHLQGMWLAFSLASMLTAYFVSRLTREMEESEAALADARERAANQDHMVAVAALTAGAAHELGTPLATIAVAARELERHVGQPGFPRAAPLFEDVALIRTEVERCKAILGRLRSNSSHAPEGELEDQSAWDVVEKVVTSLSRRDKDRLSLTPPSAPQAPRLQRGAFEHITRNLLRNALEASSGPVALSVNADRANLTLQIHDDGPGMTNGILTRVGEPFFSTKEPGQGLGLGVFVARMLAEQMGGRLRLTSSVGCGTTALVTIPARDPLMEAVRAR